MSPATPLKVLIVDDDETMRSVLRRLLGRLAIDDVEEAGDGGEALPEGSSSGSIPAPDSASSPKPSRPYSSIPPLLSRSRARRQQGQQPS